MEKFNIGEFYKVGGNIEETGNVIEIVEVNRQTRSYCTIVGVPNGNQTFHINSPFAKTLKPAEEKIVITRKGNKTIAKYYLGGKVMEERLARCCPEDTYDFVTGARIAFDRMFNTVEDEEDALDWDKFLNGEIFVQVTRKTADDFLNVCENEGVHWPDRAATEWNPFETYDIISDVIKELLKITDMGLGDNAWIHIVDGNLMYRQHAPEEGSEIFVWENSFDWKKFEDGKLCVKLTKETEMDFLSECEKRGYHWCDSLPTKWQPTNKDEYYLFCGNQFQKIITWGTEDFGAEVVEW